MVNSERLSVERAAAHCGVSASYLNKLRVTGGGPIYMKLSRRVTYDVADLNEWMRSKRCRSTSDIVGSVSACA